MKKYIVIISLLIVIVSLAFAQYDERAILYQQASQLTSQRQFTEAEQAWLQILQKYPNDVTAIAQLFQLYLQINKTENAEKLLKDYRTVLPDNVWMEYDIQLDIFQAKLKDAWDKSQAYLQLGPKEEQRYRLLAGYFERKGFYDQAIRLYEQGRTALTRPSIFSMEIGNNAYSSQQYEKAITEYMKFLETQPGNIYFVGNQLKNIFNENPELITTLKTISKNSTNLDIREVYAISLSRLGRLREALQEYDLLPTEKLLAFAYEQFAAGKDSIAIMAFNTLRTKQIEVTTLGDIILKTGESYIRLRQFTQAENILAQIANPVDKKVNPQFAKMKYPFRAYLVLSDLAQWQGRDYDTIIELVTEARKFASNFEDVAEVEYRLIGIHFVYEQYEQAEKLLAKQNQTKLMDRQLYYKFLISMSKAELQKADSLLNLLILNSPSSKYVNDLLVLNILMMNLPQNAQTSFMNAYRLRLSHRDSLAVKTLYNLSVSSKDEELRVLSADWAYASGFVKWAEDIYAYNWTDETLRDYASLQRVRLKSGIAGAESMAQDFLKSNPNSVFSPGFRQILQKAPTNRPSL